jgi:hypothetical protein
MIFNVPGHIEMIRNGLLKHPIVCIPRWYVKTQTRRVNRGIYQVGRDYAVQRKRGVTAETDIRIVIDKIEKETGKIKVTSTSGRKYVFVDELYISKEDAQAEGNYTPEEYEKVFREVNPKWGGRSRWAFAFHVIEVQK